VPLDERRQTSGTVQKAAEPADPGRRRIARTLTAAELFSRANAARRRGDIAAAVGLFEKLQGRFPESQEQLVSRVTLGRMLLQQVKYPLPALQQFDAYLAQGGPLEEEAMVGRALALERLGRRDEERKAWQQLLQKFPDSMHADHAQQRLGARTLR
jgi:TolA-binding protein